MPNVLLRLQVASMNITSSASLNGMLFFKKLNLVCSYIYWWLDSWFGFLLTQVSEKQRVSYLLAILCPQRSSQVHTIWFILFYSYKKRITFGFSCSQELLAAVDKERLMKTTSNVRSSSSPTIIGHSNEDDFHSEEESSFDEQFLRHLTQAAHRRCTRETPISSNDPTPTDMANLAHIPHVQHQNANPPSPASPAVTSNGSRYIYITQNHAKKTEAFFCLVYLLQLVFLIRIISLCLAACPVSLSYCCVVVNIVENALLT